MKRPKFPYTKTKQEYEYLPTHKNIETHVFCIGDSQIPVILCKNQLSKKNKILLCSHGNSTDLSKYYDFLCELSQELQCDALCYEYSGYGPTPGKISDKLIIQNIETAYDFIVNVLEYSCQNVILYSHSLGSGPSIFLASNFQKPVGGLLLNSPLSSGLKLVFPNHKAVFRQDFFPNFEMITYVNCPVFIMHGEQDEIIPIQHGKQLYSKLKKTSKYNPWWVNNARHNDIQHNNREEFFERLSNFIEYCHHYCLQKSEKDISADQWNPKFQHIYADWKKQPSLKQQKNRFSKSQSVFSASQFNTTVKDDMKSQKYHYEDENIPPISNKNKSEMTLSNHNFKNSEKMKKKDIRNDMAIYFSQHSDIIKQNFTDQQSGNFKINKAD